MYDTQTNMLHLAKALIGLPSTTTEVCTPGHRMGKGFAKLAQFIVKQQGVHSDKRKPD